MRLSAERAVDIHNAAVFQDNAALDLAIEYLAAVVNAGEGTDVAILD